MREKTLETTSSIHFLSSFRESNLLMGKWTFILLSVVFFFTRLMKVDSLDLTLLFGFFTILMAWITCRLLEVEESTATVFTLLLLSHPIVLGYQVLGGANAYALVGGFFTLFTHSHYKKHPDIFSLALIIVSSVILFMIELGQGILFSLSLTIYFAMYFGKKSAGKKYIIGNLCMIAIGLFIYGLDQIGSYSQLEKSLLTEIPSLFWNSPGFSLSLIISLMLLIFVREDKNKFSISRFFSLLPLFVFTLLCQLNFLNFAKGINFLELVLLWPLFYFFLMNLMTKLKIKVNLHHALCALLVYVCLSTIPQPIGSYYSFFEIKK